MHGTSQTGLGPVSYQSPCTEVMTRTSPVCLRIDWFPSTSRAGVPWSDSIIVEWQGNILYGALHTPDVVGNRIFQSVLTVYVVPLGTCMPVTDVFPLDITCVSLL